MQELDAPISLGTMKPWLMTYWPMRGAERSNRMAARSLGQSLPPANHRTSTR
jgi:hypothetical protein